jgi:hypothetical protein
MKELIRKLLREGFENNQLLAPNGKPTNLTPELYQLVRTPAFKGWFGDWEDGWGCSKILDDNGEPIVMYHGTQKEFTKFSKDVEAINRTTNLDGFYFSSNKSVATHYTRESGTVHSCFLNITRPVNIQKYRPSEKAVQYIADKYKNQFHEDYLTGKLYDLRERGVNSFMTGADRTQIAIIDGYDGMIDGSIKYGEVCAFHPEQIKDASGRNKTFNQNTPEIYTEREF